MAAHHEIHFEECIIKKLVANGWVEGSPEAYDKLTALYPEDVVAWVQKTQPETWEKIVRNNNGDAPKILVQKLAKALDSKTGSTIKVLRDGFSFAGAGKIDMIQRAPEDARNTKTVAKYKENILRVVRQLKYCPTREWAIDLVFFINGIPVATVELKTDFTQSIEHATNQYKYDRLPKDPKTGRVEPLLTFKRGAIVHFAMTDSVIEMTTRLNGKNTFFLPFNKGNNGHAGNPPREDGEYRTAYFWEEVCRRDTWLRKFTNFVYVETKEKFDKTGRPYTAETLIFPRYHQLEAVNMMLDDVKAKGAGNQYLFEHSAGSGKTNTIAWTAHDLIKLREPDGQSVFDSVIIVTDRTVLDDQLQEAVQQLDHQYGVIEAIDRKTSNKPKSQQLADALKVKVPIIVVTIQTFPYAMEAIITEQTLKDRKFAVIIDEAHTSQTGSTAQGLRAALSLDEKTKLEEMTVEEILLEVQKSRVQPPNISHFAFTATPKSSTYTLFGRVQDATKSESKENPKRAFHKYTQRQAIEEGFILDVLQNYVNYYTAFSIGQSAVNNKRVDKKMANRQLAKWKQLHPTNVAQKVEFIMKHFEQNVAHLLHGEAKAMVVTSSRAQAVKYKLAFDKYLKTNSIDYMKTLVAFSGKVPGNTLGQDSEEIGIDYDAEYSEFNLNPDMNGQDLRNVFEQDEYRVMIVANKFQTGFNQPKLVAMYLDKKISNVDAVQTLSRLNRTYPGKDQTFVIDFANEPESILNAFKTYDNGAELEDVQDVDVVYDIKEILDSANIYNTTDLENFKKLSHKLVLGEGKNNPDDPIHKKLFAATDRASDIFNDKLKNLNETVRKWEDEFNKAHAEGNDKGKEIAEAKRSEFTIQRESLMRFKTDLGRFVRVYNYIAQLIELADADLENFAAYARLLSKRLKGVTQDSIDLSGLLLKGYAIKKRNGETEGEAETLKPITANTSDANDREKQFLDEILARINEEFGGVTPENSAVYFVSQVMSHVTTEEHNNVVEQVKNNSRETALSGDIGDLVRDSVVKTMTSNMENAQAALSDEQKMNALVGVVVDLIQRNKAADIIDSLKLNL